MFGKAQSSEQNMMRPYYGNKIFKLQIGDKFGTGFLIKDKLLVTNFHVVKDVVEALRSNKVPEKIICSSGQMIELLQDHDNFNLEAKVFDDYIQSDSVYHYSKLTDVIILDLSNNENLGDSDGIEIQARPHLITGEEVFTIGFPMTNLRSSVSKGVVGFMNMVRVYPWENPGTALNSITTYQTDIRTTRGGSGSPIIVRGENGETDKVVGVLNSGTFANAATVENLWKKYKSKADSLIVNGSNLKLEENNEIMEKYVIYDTLLNDVATIAVFIDSHHIVDLLKMLGLESE
jgi:S1-C subfamily serine protease